MSHAHTVLHLQQCRQERLEVKVSHRVEVRLLADVGAIEDRLEALPGVVLTESRPIDLVAQTWSAIDEAEVAAVEIFEKAVAPELLKHGFVIPKCNEVGNDRLVRDDELAGVHRALDRPLDALLEIGNQVAGIAAKDLVATLPSKQDLAMLAGQPGDHELRERPWARHRIVEVINDLLDGRSRACNRPPSSGAPRHFRCAP